MPLSNLNLTDEQKAQITKMLEERNAALTDAEKAEIKQQLETEYKAKLDEEAQKHATLLAEAQKEFESNINKVKSESAKTQDEITQKYEELKSKYITKEQRDILDKEEQAEKAALLKKQIEEGNAKAARELAAKELELAAKELKLITIEVASELKVPANMQKYLTGKNKDEVKQSATELLEAIKSLTGDFDAAVEKAVEEKFKTGHIFKKGVLDETSLKAHIENYRKMSVMEKLDFMNKEPETWKKVTETLNQM